HFSAQPVGRGSGQFGTARLAADPTLSARKFRIWTRPPGPAGRPPAAALWLVGAGFPPYAPDRRGIAAGMFRNHCPCLRQSALRYDLPDSELPALARRNRASRGLSVSQAISAAPPVSDAGWRALGAQMPRPRLRTRCDNGGLSG